MCLIVLCNSFGLGRRQIREESIARRFSSVVTLLSELLVLVRPSLNVRCSRRGATRWCRLVCCWVVASSLPTVPGGTGVLTGVWNKPISMKLLLAVLWILSSLKVQVLKVRIRSELSGIVCR